MSPPTDKGKGKQVQDDVMDEDEEEEDEEEEEEDEDEEMAEVSFCSVFTRQAYSLWASVRICAVTLTDTPFPRV